MDKRATAAHIRHFVADAAAKKSWARSVPPQWRSGASTVSVNMLDGFLRDSVLQIARRSLSYARHRAFMSGAYSNWPGDKPAYDLWQSLCLRTPARFYCWQSGEYRERIGGAGREYERKHK
jgi:hypothetical protein